MSTPQGVPLPADEQDLPGVNWSSSTAADTPDYARLQLLLPAIDYVPAVPLGFFPEVRGLAVLFPAVIAPCPPAGLFKP